MNKHFTKYTNAAEEWVEPYKITHYVSAPYLKNGRYGTDEWQTLGLLNGYTKMTCKYPGNYTSDELLNSMYETTTAGGYYRYFGQSIARYF